MIEINTPNIMYSVIFTADGQHLLSAGAEAIVWRWRVDNGSEVGEPIQTAGAQIFATALSPDGKWLVCGLYGDNSNVRVWDAHSHKQVFGVKGHTTAVFSVDTSPDSMKFATGGYDNSAIIWSMTTGTKMVGPLQHESTVVAVRFSPGGDCIATATAEESNVPKSIRIWNSNNGQRLLDIPFQTTARISSSLAWSKDGRQLYAASNKTREVSRFDASSGTLLSKWSVPGGGQESTSIILSRSQRFAVVAASRTLSFWDTSTYTQIGTAIEHASRVWFVSLSSEDNFIATGENNGKITIRDLRDILPALYFDVNSSVVPRQESLVSSGFTPSVSSKLPFLQIDYAACNSWWQGDLTCAEELLTEKILHPSDTDSQAHALANRSLVRTRSGNRDMAIDDAKASIGTQRTVIGCIAHAVARLRNGEHDYALRAFDLVFSEGLATENNLLLLIRAIILFESEKRTDAISRVDDLIDIVDDQSVYITIRAEMHLLLAGVMLRDGDHLRATELLKKAREAPPPQGSPHLILISLIFGWDFDELAPSIEQCIQECIKVHEEIGDTAMKSEDMEDANIQYSAALSLGPSNRAAILVKRSKARGMLELWEEAMEDADEAVQEDPSNPWGFERRRAALHAFQRFEEAVDAFTHMLSLIENSPDQDVRQLGKKYVSRSKSENRIDSVIRGVFKISPLVLIDVQSGRLCDMPERLRTFKSESEFKELISSMTEALDDARIMQTVAKYFQYVTFSHVWQGKEPSFQDVNAVQSVWNLDSSPLNEKLKGFCEVVRTDGYRWAWSDTCCIDKTISTVLNQSLTMMYKWYESSAATLIFLTTADSLSVLGALTDSLWMTRAWTAQELLAAKVVRFYDRNWKLYLGDTRRNHKESPEIMEELAKAIGIPGKTIAAFNPNDLTVREKLRVASTRNATVEEDMAYSLIGIFNSDIRPHYGEGDAALGHLLEEIVARSGEVTVLDWIGRSSPYNSCLPANLIVYSRPPSVSPVFDDAEMDVRVGELRSTLSQADATLIHDRITRLPPARFANRRLHLPCVYFPVKRLGVQGNKYRARVSGIGFVEFQGSDRFPLNEPRKLVFVHPWIGNLRDPLVGFSWGSVLDDEGDSDRDTETESAPSSPLQTVPGTAIDSYTRALRLVARLQQPFHALLLQQQPGGEFRRVAAEHEIVIPGIERQVNSAKDIRIGTVEIL